MPAKNVYHDIVVAGLVADGWTITEDPLLLEFGGHNLFVDLGLTAPTIAAEQTGRKIAVEIQSFSGRSVINDLHRAVGQFLVYRSVMAELQTGLPLYLAVPEDIYLSLFNDQLGRLILSRLIQRMMVFHGITGKVIQWIG